MTQKLWNPQRQLGELVGEVRNLPTGGSISLPGGVKIGAVAIGRRGASRQRQFAVVQGTHRTFKRSASEAAHEAMTLSKKTGPFAD